MLAHTISTITQMAAMGVSFGFMLSNIGSTNPRPPSRSTMPVNFTKAGETCPAQGHIAATFSGCNSFIEAAQTMLEASSNCATQRVIFNALEGFCVAAIVSAFNTSNLLILFTFRKFMLSNFATICRYSITWHGVAHCYLLLFALLFYC